MRVRFSLSGLMAVVLLVAVGLAALRSLPGFLADGPLPLILGSVAVAILIGHALGAIISASIGGPSARIIAARDGPPPGPPDCPADRSSPEGRRGDAGPPPSDDFTTAMRGGMT